VILSGDAAQHTSVERGDALRLLEKYAGLKSAELTEIRRQRSEQYREAVRDLAKGNVLGGFEKLDRLGCVKELPEAERYSSSPKITPMRCLDGKARWWCRRPTSKGRRSRQRYGMN
jgi:hypothetical protein